MDTISVLDGTMTKRQLRHSHTTRSAGVGGFGLVIPTLVGLGRVGRYIQIHNFEFWTAQRTDSAAATAAAAAAPGVETKRSQRRSRNQPHTVL